MTKNAGNSLQAILNRVSAEPAASPAAPIAAEAEGKPAKVRGRRPAASPATAPLADDAAAPGRKRIQASRIGTKMIGGHFDLAISQQLRMLAIEEDTTVQLLLEEAITDLLTKKAGRKVRR